MDKKGRKKLAELAVNGDTDAFSKLYGVLSQVLSLLFRAAHVVWRLDRLIPFAAIFAVPFTAHYLRLAISLYHTDPDSNRSDREVSPITHRIIHNDSYLEITM